MALNSLFASLRILPCIRSLSQKPVHFNLFKFQSLYTPCSSFQTTSKRNDLMEFFDDKKNWSESDIQVGRSWRTDELRIKSNSDLHKLWYVLLKERNMLLTMEQECNAMIRLFPNPERIDKVEESMKNLETVVRERNVAYHTLETGYTGERPAQIRPTILGVRRLHRTTEHLVPRWAQISSSPKPDYGAKQNFEGRAVKKFLKLYREKLSKEKRREIGRHTNHVIQLIKRFPNMDMEKLKAAYPDVDMEKALRSKKAVGHYIKES